MEIERGCEKKDKWRKRELVLMLSMWTEWAYQRLMEVVFFVFSCFYFLNTFLLLFSILERYNFIFFKITNLPLMFTEIWMDIQKN